MCKTVVAVPLIVRESHSWIQAQVLQRPARGKPSAAKLGGSLLGARRAARLTGCAEREVWHPVIISSDTLL